MAGITIDWQDSGGWLLAPAPEWDLGCFVPDYLRRLTGEILGLRGVALTAADLVTFEQAREAITDVLTRADQDFLRQSITRLTGGDPGSLAGATIRVTHRNEGVFAGIFQVDVLSPIAKTFGLVVAREPRFLGRVVRNDFHNLQSAAILPARGRQGRCFGDHVTRPLVLSDGACTAGGRRCRLPLFSVQWLEGYRELHRETTINNGNCFLDLMPPVHFYDRSESKTILAEVIGLLVLLFESSRSPEDAPAGQGLAINPLLLQAGDIVVKQQDGARSLKIITIRNLRHATPAGLLHSLLEHRELDLQGREIIALFLDESEEVVEAVNRALVDLYGEEEGRTRLRAYLGPP